MSFNGVLYSYTASPSDVTGPCIDPTDPKLGRYWWGWLNARSVFPGVNKLGHCIYVVTYGGQLQTYVDTSPADNVSNSTISISGPVIVGNGGWAGFAQLFAGVNSVGANCIYAVDGNGQLLSYVDDGTTGNVSQLTVVSLDNWSKLKLFAGRKKSGTGCIFAVDHQGKLLSYSDNGETANVSVSQPAIIGEGAWHEFQFLFAGADTNGTNCIYGVNGEGQLFAYPVPDNGPLPKPTMVGKGAWLEFGILFAGASAPGNRIYGVGQSPEYRPLPKDLPRMPGQPRPPVPQDGKPVI